MNEIKVGHATRWRIKKRQPVEAGVMVDVWPNSLFEPEVKARLTGSESYTGRHLPPCGSGYGQYRQLRLLRDLPTYVALGNR